MKYFVVILWFYTISLFPQTYFQGGIYSDVTWTLAQSPYIITGDVVVFPQKTLTIEPGVRILVAGYYRIEIRGNIRALGQSSSRIEFTRDSSTITTNDSLYWLGIQIKTDQGATGDFAYCIFSAATGAIEESCCNHQQSVFYRNIIFKNNLSAITGYNGFKSLVDSCEFYGNQYAIMNADKNIKNSIFINNKYGLYATERIDIDSSYFAQNETAIYGGRGLLRNTIIENNGIGVKSFFEGYNIQNCKILNNDIGLQLGSYSNYYLPTKNNNICNNRIYNVENLDDINKDITKNCWCTSDSAEIESKLYDGYDNIYVGLLNYSIYDSTCINELTQVIKIVLDVEDFRNISTNYKLEQNYPNPFNPSTKISWQSPVSGWQTLKVYDILGKEVATLVDEYRDAGNYEVDFPSVETLHATSLPSGVYFYQLKSGDYIETKKMILLK